MQIDNGNLILLTGTIDCSVYNDVVIAISDCDERLTQYESAIERYIKLSSFDKIVFIENSGYKFNSAKYEEMALKHNKQFEFINGDIHKKEINRCGRSWGDAFLIHEAIVKSKLLRNVSEFYKITGRVFLKNSDEIIRKSKNIRNCFMMYPRSFCCGTFFFKVNKKDYLYCFDNSYMSCDEEKGVFIENVFCAKIMKYRKKIDCKRFGVYPIFDGKVGANLASYTPSGIKLFVSKTLFYLGMGNPNSVFCRLIIDYYFKNKPIEIVNMVNTVCNE